jgi:hypothetical protein
VFAHIFPHDARSNQTTAQLGTVDHHAFGAFDSSFDSVRFGGGVPQKVHTTKA